ncbi:MAG: adenosylcobinamide-GDP ribazoletransferase [Methanothrix sp.]|uniref:adenosylcobinamide-GDP ribazoletransferase n=1 Tax=Methanothrix sp. TaxID=90426 RepID=UPI00247E79D3|nr:adenosylcobinamide-GDP ribazoletransferase [Methanothrix sp.]
MLFAVRSGFGFLSTIPVGISMEGIEALMRHVYIFPIIGLSLGLIFAAVAYLLGLFLPPDINAICIMIAIYWVCGINHIDGLADFGDGVTAHGSPEKKIKAMKDVNLGSGGAVFVILVLLALFSAIRSMDHVLLPAALVVSEISAKQSMLAFAAFTEPFKAGLGQIMIERTGKREFLTGLIISSTASALLLKTAGVIMLMLSILSALHLARVSRRNFGGGSGDGIGASNEIGRATALCAALVLGVTGWTVW